MRRITEEWKYYGGKSGWTLKLLLKKKNLFFFSPQLNSFGIAFVLGDRAIKAAFQSDLPDELIEELKAARKYAEGTGLRLDVKKRSDLNSVKKLLRIKIEN